MPFDYLNKFINKFVEFSPPPKYVLDPEFEASKATVEILIEGNSDTSMMLYLLLKDKIKVTGCGARGNSEIACYYYGMPVNISMMFETINGKKVCIWESVGMVSHWDTARDFIKKTFPGLKSMNASTAVYNILDKDQHHLLR